TSHGAVVHYHLDSVTGTLTGYTGSNPATAANQVFVVTLDDTSGTGTYNFSLLRNLDHPVANSEDDVTIKFGFTARDADSDPVDGIFSVTVDDDSPIITPASIQNGVVDEERLPTGNPGDTYSDGGDL